MNSIGKYGLGTTVLESLPRKANFTSKWMVPQKLTSESLTYTANLCPLWGRAEFASLGEDFGEPIRNAVEAAPRRAIG